MQGKQKLREATAIATVNFSLLIIPAPGLHQHSYGWGMDSWSSWDWGMNSWFSTVLLNLWYETNCHFISSDGLNTYCHHHFFLIVEFFCWIHGKINGVVEKRMAVVKKKKCIVGLSILENISPRRKTIPSGKYWKCNIISLKWFWL